MPPPSLRRVAPLFSVLWLAAVLYDVTYFRYKSLFGIPEHVACVGESCDISTDTPPPLPYINTTNNTTTDTILKQKDPVHLVYASDEDSMMAVEASIRSALHHASEPIYIHFVGNTRPKISSKHFYYYNLTTISKQYRLKEFTNPKKRGNVLAGLNSNEANFVRFVISDILPNATKAMWIDADTIFQCDMVDMIRTALQNTTTTHTIAAVPVEGPPHGVMNRVKRKYLKKFKWSFNAGVYVVDLQKWREKKMTDKIRKLTLKNRKKRFYNYGSQPPLVLAIGDRFEHLAPTWNVKVNKLNLGLLKEEKACLLHWSGKRKPWNTKNDPDVHYELWTPYASNKNVTSI